MPENILKEDLPEFMGRSYINYALSVLVDRALPDVRDGLKPVHRAALYSMHELKMFHNMKGYKKGATPVGHALGYYYPHSDTSIYDATVALSQPFNMRYPLVLAHGNAGNLDGDPHAAMRYLELKLSHIGETLMDDFDKNVCDQQDNFDATKKWPTYFGTLIPNSIINGTEGIAVAMATKTVPHNLTEVYSALSMMIQKRIECEALTTADIMHHIKGPDFPLGANILGINGIASYIETGRGKIVMRASYDIETKKDRAFIIIKDLPYRVNRKKLMDRIEELMETKLKEIKSVEDDSSKDVMNVRLILELKKEANIAIVINKLCKFTDFQCNWSVNNNYIINGIPKTCSLITTLNAFIDHSYDVVKRRISFDLNSNLERLEKLKLLLWTIENSTAVSEAIKMAADTYESLKLLSATLTKEQADYISNIQLKQMSNSSRIRYEEELKNVTAIIKEQESILQDPTKIYEEVMAEYAALSRKFGDERRTQITTTESDIDSDDEDLIDDEELVLMYSTDHLVKLVEEKELKQTRRGAKGIKSGLAEDDNMKYLLSLSNKDTVYFFTSTGRCHMVKGYNLPKVSRTARGRSINNFINLDADEQVISLMSESTSSEKVLVLVTEKGLIKKLDFNNLTFRKNVTRVITFREDDHLVSANMMNPASDLAICTREGLAIAFSLEDLRATGKSAMGVTGIRFKKENDVVVDCTEILPDHQMLTITSLGFGKQTDFSSLRRISRGGKGSTCHNITKKTGVLISMLSIEESDEVIFATSNGKLLRIDGASIRTSGRNASGVKLANLEADDYIISASLKKKELDVNDTP